MNEELKKLRKSIKMLEAKMEFQKENTQQMYEITRQIGQDLDDFIEVYSIEMEKIDKRFARLEKHVGLE